MVIEEFLLYLDEVDALDEGCIDVDLLQCRPKSGTSGLIDILASVRAASGPFFWHMIETASAQGTHRHVVDNDCTLKVLLVLQDML